MAMKVDYGMVRKVTMIFKFEDFSLCFEDWSSLCNALLIAQERRMSEIVKAKVKLKLKITLWITLIIANGQWMS
jgi:hypothetical protein